MPQARVKSGVKVAQLNFNDLSGGATRAAIRQNTALRLIGIESRFHVLTKQSDDFAVVPFDYRVGLLRRIARRLHKTQITRDFASYLDTRPEGFEQFTDDRVHLGSSVFQRLDGASVANLHWVAGYCDYRAIFTELLDTRPVVWTLHDQNAFTGGCHYDHGCGRFAAQCGCCPQLGSRNENDLSAHVWLRKREAIISRSRNNRFCVVSPSHWLAEEARRSSLFRNQRIEVIPYGLDTDLYRPGNRSNARLEHGLQETDQVILFLASGAAARRKGFSWLDEAVSGLSERDSLVVVTAGGKAPTTSGAYRHLHLGSVTDETRLAAVYGMVDLFAVPSLEDNLPLACQEALSCGTPVVGFAVGGIPDMVINGKTGMLVPPRDAAGLARAISSFFSDPELAPKLSRGAREHALRYYTYARNADAYRKVYESLVG